MKTRRVLKLVGTFQPTTPEQALVNCGLGLKYIGEGAYRHTYHILGTNLVIKFPKQDGIDGPSTCNIQHALEEFKTISRILKSKASRYQAIKKHMPRIYYCDHHGVTISSKYKLLPMASHRNRAKLSDYISTILRVYDGDLTNPGNVGVDGRGTLKILDGGMLDDQW